jgi:ferredoxin
MTYVAVIGGVLVLSVLGLWVFGERGNIVLNSTRKWMMDSHWPKKNQLMDAIHGYIYMRWQNQYIKYLVIQSGKIAPKPVREYFKNHYHAKVLPHEAAREIIEINESISRKDLEQVVPYPNARDFLLKVPQEIMVYECGCRNAREHHCEPTQVCMWIGQPYIDFILEHNPHSARRINREEALKILQKEHERGHVHTAWFKDAMQDRFYCICNCCSCCCAGMEAMRNYGVQFIASSGYVAQLSQQDCTGCGQCVETCPFQAVSLENGQAKINWNQCMGCGVCVDQCPNAALQLVQNAEKGIPFDIRALYQSPMQ